MIKDKAKWADWEDRNLSSEPPDFQRNLQILESMYEHARAMGAFSGKDPLAGLEVKIRMARILNVPTPARADRPRP